MPSLADRPLDLGQLRAALAVRETGTVTRAAEDLGLSQPAVSRLIAALETELGFDVFERTRRRLVLTERGREFLDEAQSAMRSMARLSVMAGELRRGRHGLLRVGAIAPLALGLVAPAIAAYRRDAPSVTVEVDLLPRARQIEELRAGRIDIALAAMPFSGAGLRVEPILEADAVCVLPASHRLARRRVINLSDLAEEGFVLASPASILRQRLDDAFRQSNIVQRTVSVVENMSLVAVLVSAGAGVAVTHAMPAAAMPSNVVTRAFRPRIPFSYAIVTQAGDVRSRAVSDFCRALRAVAHDVRRDVSRNADARVAPRRGRAGRS